MPYVDAVQLRLFGPAETSPEVSGDADLRSTLEAVVAAGFPHVTSRAVPSVEVRWNSRLRSTVGRVTWPDGGHVRETPLIEVAPGYHDAYPHELRETLAHEFAHVVTPGGGHGPAWKAELAAALQRLGIEVRASMRFARNQAPQRRLRYEWACAACAETVAYRPRRRADEVAVESSCCKARIVVLDSARGGEMAPPRPFVAGCRRCGHQFRAYDDAAAAAHFARRHRCRRCGRNLQVSTRR